MKNETAAETRAVELLQSILDRAAEVGADMVDLERVPDGLEILYCSGHTGVGGLLETPELEAPLIKLIVRRARLHRKAGGSFTWKVQGRNRTIAVEEYDSFGEACFRLKFGRAT
ncbi:MAG: hypothetical protein HY736_12240 [Verrucomicrobia bacterium]|nr:hypothetical protein [Verrucomicrobiota bacterium]